MKAHQTCKHKNNVLFFTLLVLSLPVVLLAQSPNPELKTDPASAAVWETNKALADGLKVRVDLVNGIVGGQLETNEAIAQLAKASTASGLQVERAADFAIGAIDVGRRLVATRQPAAAAEFFRAAEQSLAEGLRKSTARAPRDQALLLGRLAAVRGSYLNKRAQARADLDQAIALEPDNQKWRRARGMLVGAGAESSQQTARN